ncbi:MAG: hypothetical protein KDC71_24080 [Acidobacteria bacterium]|nr:hypothetical protein [Acidobacteriota bacterium]
MTRKARTTIYPGPPINTVFDQYPETSQTAVLNTICSRYLALVRKNIPEFEPEEWVTIFGAYHTQEPFSAERVHMEWALVEEAGGGKRLVEKMQGTTFSESMAIRELADRYWAQHSDLETPERVFQWVQTQ